MDEIKMLSGKYVITASTKEITEEQWKKNRTLGIGGSEVGALLGLNKYKSPLSLYLDKIGEGKPFEGNIHTEYGKRLEPVIREWLSTEYAIRTKEEIIVEEYPYMMRSIETPCCLANIDGIVTLKGKGVGILEIKTASEMMRKEWVDDNIPDSYYAQVQFYMYVSGLQYTLLAYLIGKTLAWEFVPRNEEFIRVLVTKAKDFWENNVLKEVEPLVIGIAADTEALSFRYPEETAGNTVDMSELEADYTEYKNLTADEKEIKTKVDMIKQKFMVRMGTAEVGTIGEHKVTWKTIHKKSFTVKESSSRQMRVY